jgi:hypothetical protein
LDCGSWTSLTGGGWASGGPNILARLELYNQDLAQYYYYLLLNSGNYTNSKQGVSEMKNAKKVRGFWAWLIGDAVGWDAAGWE